MLFLYMFCALWGYGAVFGEALATYAPVPFLGDMGAYRMYVVLFGLVVVPLSTLDIKEQATFQVRIFAWYRVRRRDNLQTPAGFLVDEETLAQARKY